MKISNQRINPENIFLYHKTTQRYIYTKQLKAANKEGFDEVIFLNQKGELTEGAFHNIFVRQKNKFYTPPLSCGLLNGVLRRHLINKGVAEEKRLYLSDLENTCLYLGNSVRGLQKAEVYQPALKRI